jgi:hypothetical protein
MIENENENADAVSEADAAKAEIQAKFDEQEECFRAQEGYLAILRAFTSKHRDAMAPFHWKAYGWNDTEIAFDIIQYPAQDPKAIARAFGADGWKRVPDGYTCGSINWRKELDGCVLIIKYAENIKPTLREDVRL